MRTFAGLALFLMLSLLSLGFYLIADEFANPLASQFALFIGASILSVAMILLYELIQLPRKIWRNPAESSSLRAARVRVRVAIAAAQPACVAICALICRTSGVMSIACGFVGEDRMAKASGPAWWPCDAQARGIAGK